ncbi:MAG: alpha/beta hydrolase [Candidatus Andeanibacterium colombiense]|uniref:Alpha/beta hydrolase n=1 Tax=Candidatus Andeanibacterium colombiense TaxID=3121345 RepID=A0AAJ5X660_9SPHN|nr:MAG: alpha/beta hydrolase [Sphingomonadaceae bacterium]
MRRGFAISGVALALAPLASVPAQRLTPAGVDSSLAPYADTTNSVRLPDGRMLHLVCMGQGSPTVIFNGGGDTWSTMWNTVQPEVAQKTRACAWDRQALGLSSAGPEVPTVEHNVADLDAALKLAGIAGPYVVVGHSLGGYDSVIFADRHKEDVVGMVLVDPTPAADPDAPPDPATPNINALMAGEPPFITMLQRCAAGLRAGTLHSGAPDPDNCLNPPPPPAEYPPELRDALLALRVGATPQATAAALDNIAYYSSAARIAADTRAAYNPARNYGAMPLIVLSAGDSGISPNNPPEINAELPALMAFKQRAHEHLATLSTRGVHRIIADSPHDIPHVKPQAVIDAIDEVVDAAR